MKRFVPVPSESDRVRFWSKVSKSDHAEGCWEWQAGTEGFGYGHFWLSTKRPAHRVSWYLTYNCWPLLDVLHRCDNPKCVNPDHLFLGTQADNVADCISKGRRVSPEVRRLNGKRTAHFGDDHYSHRKPHLCVRGERHGIAKLNESKVREIRKLFSSGSYTYKKLSLQFGVAISQIWMVVTRQTWKHVK